MTANTLTEVITQLDKVIDWSSQSKSRIGYFAALYRKMTVAVGNAIANGVFENGERMERLDVVFANRYLQAWQAYITNKPCTLAWRTTFNSNQYSPLIVLQHLFTGINAHINLDLAIAAADTCPGASIGSLRRDFDNINDIIFSLIKVVEQDLVEVWPPLKYLTGITQHRQEQLLHFSITTARKASWMNAVALATSPNQTRSSYINKLDGSVTVLANRIINPGFAVQFILQPVALLEGNDVKKIIDLLYH